MKPILLDLPMPITTPRLIIRPSQIGDGTIVNAAIVESFPRLHQYMDWAKECPSITDSEEQVRLAAANWLLKKAEEPWLQLFIFNRENNQFVGATGYHSIDWEVPRVATGYWVRTSCERQGYITEALNAITQYAFKQLAITRIEITCANDNERSKKIPERLGYPLEGILKAYRRHPVTQKLSDTLVYARTDMENLPALTVKW